MLWMTLNLRAGICIYTLRELVWKKTKEMLFHSKANSNPLQTDQQSQNFTIQAFSYIKGSLKTGKLCNPMDGLWTFPSSFHRGSQTLDPTALESCCACKTENKTTQNLLTIKHNKGVIQCRLSQKTLHLQFITWHSGFTHQRSGQDIKCYLRQLQNYEDKSGIGGFVKHLRKMLPAKVLNFFLHTFKDNK